MVKHMKQCPVALVIKAITSSNNDLLLYTFQIKNFAEI